MERTNTINIADTVDNSRVGGFQVGIFALCAACLIMDGFDVQIMGVVAPEIVGEFELSTVQMGYATTAGLLGILLGAFLFSILGDRFGRRPVLIVATLYFAVITLATGFVQSLTPLVVLRFLGGIGLCGIMPNLVALVGEYSPKRSRAFITMLVQNGFNIGAMLVGLSSLYLIPEFGWRTVFFVGGTIPIVIGLAMLVFLPESLQFLALRGTRDARLAKWLKRVDPSVVVTAETQLVARDQAAPGVPVAQLFHSGRAVGTSLLWSANFMNLLLLYFLAQWLPIVFRNAGMSQANAIWVATTLQGGGVVGTLILGWLISKYGYVRTLSAAFGLGCIAVALMGQSASLAVLFSVVFVAGFCVVGGQGGLNSLAANFYPTHVRSTGIGSALGIGRFGAIVGQPIAAGLLGRGLTPAALLLVAALPGAITSASVFALRRRVRSQGSSTAEAVQPAG
jgi:AAHS family 4-hydroxybenzoate transporter-like MFS transporter